MTEAEQAGELGQEAPARAQTVSRLRMRLSATGYVILALVAAQLVLIVLAIVMPWGHSSQGRDIRLGLEGLVPWFLLVPAAAQVGFLMVESGMLQAFYLVIDLLVSLLVLGVMWLTTLKYTTSFQPGFYVVFIAAALALVGGLLCMVERRLFPEKLDAGKARVAQRHAAGAGG